MEVGGGKECDGICGEGFSPCVVTQEEAFKNEVG